MIVRFNVKSFFAGLLVASLVGTGTLAFAETSQTIQAVFGKVKLMVNNKPVEQETLLYNGTAYVPLRAAAEILDKDVFWDADTNIAYIEDKAPVDLIPVAVQSSNLKSGEKKAENSDVKIKQKELPFRIGQIEYELEILPPNRVGNIYMQTYYANRTDHTITNFSIKWFDKGARKERYLSLRQYVEPNFVSDVFKGLGPQNGYPADIELWETNITFLNNDGKKAILKYDHRTDAYAVSGNW